MHRNALFFQVDADLGLFGDFIQSGGQAAACGVAQHMHFTGGGNDVLDHSIQGRGIRSDIREKGEIFAAAHDGQAMVAQRAADQHRVAGAGAVPGGGRVNENFAHARGVDEDFIAGPARHHFGVAGDDLHIGGAGRLAHVRDHALQGVQGQAFLQDEGAAQIAGPRAEHGHVVDRAVHGQTADAAARKKERRHGVGIRAHGQGAAQAVQQGRVIQAFQQRVGEMAQKTLRHQAL